MSTTSEFPAHIAELMAKANTTTLARQDVRVAATDEVVVTGVFRYFQYWDNATSKNVQTPVVPAVVNKQSKKKDKNGAVKKYPAELEVMVQVKDIPLRKDKVEPRVDGGHGWQVKTAVEYHKDAENYLMKYKDAFYAGTYETSFPFAEYITPDGKLTTERWVNVGVNQLVKIKVNGGDQSSFRKLDDNKRPIIQPLTLMRFPNITGKMWVAVREKEEEKKDVPVSAEGAETAPGDEPPTKKAAPSVRELHCHAYFSLKSKGAPVVSEDNDPNMPLTERIHSRENKDAHNMVPIEVLRQGGSLDKSAFFYACQGYCTPNPEQDPNKKGVHIGFIPTTEISDLVSTFNNETKYRKTVRLNVFQWTGLKPSYTNQYTVKLVSRPDTWMSFGILNGEAYGLIMHANYDMSMLITAEPFLSGTLNADCNKPDVINNKPELMHVKGNYTYYIQDLQPDYLRWLPTNGIPLTKDCVLREFDSFLIEDQRRGKTTLKLSTDGLKNPLHADKANSPVICLGSVSFPCYDDDAWPLFSTHDFYAVTSHRLSPDERYSYTGVKPSAVVDEFFYQLRDSNQQFAYVFFAVKRGLPMAKDYVPPVLRRSDADGGDTPEVGQKRERDDDEEI